MTGPALQRGARAALLAVAAAAAVAAVVLGAAVGEARRRADAVTSWAAADNPGPRGLRAAAELLAGAGRPVSRRGPGEPPSLAATVILAAPRATLSEADVDELLAQARAGATVVYARAPVAQPALDGRLGLTAGPLPAPPVAIGLAPHPLTRDLSLPAGGAAIRSRLPEALPVSGAPGRATALAVPVGQGEVLVLSDAAPLENARIGEADALTLLLRLARRGPVVLDERFLTPASRPRGGPPPALAPAVAQLLLAAAALLLARGRRLGAIRPTAAAPVRTARDYLASLAALYRRAGAEPELAARSWETLRARLERAGVARRLSDVEAARRLAPRAPRASVALLRGAAARARGGPGVLLRVAQAAADVERGLSGERSTAGRHLV